MSSIKFASILFIAALVCSSVHAEGDTKLGGVRAGFHRSNIMYNGSTNAGYNETFYIGVYKNNKIIPTLHWMVGLEYFQNGYSDASSSKRLMSTVSVPVTAKFKIGPFFALGGLAGNFKLSDDFVNGGVDQGKQGSDFDVPLILGAGFSILILNIEARYHWGMIDVDEKGGRNEYLQLGVGASF